MHANEILETCLYVDDLKRAEAFYVRDLGLEFFSRQEDRHVFLKCGNRMLLIFDPTASSETEGEIPPHGACGPGHVCFAVPEAQLDDWQNHLQERDIDIEQIFDWPGGGRSIYFRDPAGNSLELATPRIWGIDESAAIQTESS